MAFELVPENFFTQPSRLPSLFEDDSWLSWKDRSGMTVAEDDKNVYVEANVPGIDPKDLEVTYQNGVLWVRGENKTEEKKKKYYHRTAQSYSYRLNVPGEIDPNKAPEAVQKNGVVQLTFTKSKNAAPKKITVKSS